VEPKPTTATDPPRLDALLEQQSACWVGRHPLLVEDLLAVAPELRDDPNALLDLIVHEITLRHRSGEDTQLGNYRIRFPWLADRLEVQLAIQRLFESGSPSKLGCQASSAVRQSSAPPGYVIESEVGRGAMGIVYRARQETLNRVVALKVVLAGAEVGNDTLARVLVEAKAVARLQHPNVVQIFEVGEHGGFPFLALEYADGGNLARAFGGAPQPPRQVAEMVETLARAVHEVHNRGIIHRDLKPANILVTAGGVLKIADFGLAKLLEEGTARTDSGAILGTPSYIAPEQLSGKSGRAGPACDIYALGTILYEGLTGRPPFHAETALQTLALVGFHDPIAPTRLTPRLPRDLEAVCLKCLEKDPRRRYSSAGSLAQDLRRFLDGRPTLARPMTFSGHTIAWARRQPVIAALLASLIVIGGLGFVGITWKWRETEAVRAQLDHNLYLNRIALAERSWSLNNPGRAERLLAECPSELRQWEWHYLKRLCHTDGLSLSANDQSIEYLAFNPTGGELATAGTDGFVRVWDIATGEQLRHMSSQTGRLHALAFSPDGCWIAAGGDLGSAIVWDARTGFEIAQLSGPPTRVAGLCFSPDGQRLVLACSRGNVSILTTEDWSETRTISVPSQADTTFITFRPDGRLIATAHSDGAVRLWEAETCREVMTLRGHIRPVFSIAFSRDGHRLASASGDVADCPSAEAKVWDLDTGREVLSLQGHTGTVSEVAFSPDSRRLATSSWDKTVKLWDTRTGAEVLTIRNQIDRLYCVAFSPDGRRLASVGNRGVVQVCDATPYPECQTTSPRFQFAATDSVAFSHDGRRIYSGGPGNTVQIWESSSGARVATLSGHTQPVTVVSCSPDGRLIISGSRDKTIRLWDSATRAQIAVLTGHDDGLTGLAVRPDSTQLGSASSDSTIRFWDLADGRQSGIARIHDLAVYCLAYSPDGRLIASVSEDRTLKISDALNGRVLTVLWHCSDRITGVAFHPDGRRVAALCSLEATAKVFNAATGRLEKTLRGVAGTHLAFSPDGARLACATSARDVKLWDTTTWDEVCILRRPSGESRIVSFSRDGRMLASASYDGVVSVWDLPEIARGSKLDPVVAETPRGRATNVPIE
jgi:WD40 repeat protein